MNKYLAKDIINYIEETTDSGAIAPDSVLVFKEKLSRALSKAKVDDKSRKFHHDYLLPFTIHGSRTADGSDVRALDVWAAIKNLIEGHYGENLIEKVGKPVHTTEVPQ